MGIEMTGQLAGLRSAPSLESFDSVATYDRETAYGKIGPSAFKYKAPASIPIPPAGKPFSSVLMEGGSEFSSCESGAQQEWMSPVKDIDLIASEDVLYDEEEDDDDDADSLHLDTSRISSCSSKNSEGCTLGAADIFFLKQRQHLEYRATFQEKPPLITSSPTKSGDFIPRPVPAYCLVAKTAEQYGFSAFVISVGTSYFQRLAAVDPALKRAAQYCPDFAPFVRDIPDAPHRVRKSIGAPLHQVQTPRHWLLAVHLTCIYLAAKNVEVVPYVHLLQTMLHRLHGVYVSQEEAEALEMEVLIALDWRLGPFFLHQEL